MFFPWVGFFEQIRLSDVYVNYKDVQYSKGSFTNRVQIKSQTGIKWLTVPLKKLHFGQIISEVEIDNTKNWQESHLKLLKNCYEFAPYYQDMISIVEGVYSKEWFLISDLAQETLNRVSWYFDFRWDKKNINIETLNIPGKGSDRVLEIALKLGADFYITGHGARSYLNHILFEQAGIEVGYMNYQKKEYSQLYGEFNPFVSILDLIANVGRNGSDYIISKTINWRNFKNE
jgi:hypothetical protein